MTPFTYRLKCVFFLSIFFLLFIDKLRNYSFDTNVGEQAHHCTTTVYMLFVKKCESLYFEGV